MKKLMIIACGIAFAAVSHAAVCNWSTGTLYAPGEGGTGYSDPVTDGTSGYLATLYVGTGYAGSAQAGYTLTGLVDQKTLGAGASNSTVQYGTIGATTADVLAETDGSFYYAQLVITFGDSELRSQVVRMDVDTMSEPKNYSPYFGDYLCYDSVTALPGMEFSETYGAFSESGWTKAVPEPTSGLLLLVGMGALALRRRRA